jgi:hypothetical protein
MAATASASRRVPGSAVSDLTKIDYSDSTPYVEFTYNRLGKIATVMDAVGERAFAYTADLLLDTELPEQLLAHAGPVRRLVRLQLGLIRAPELADGNASTVD